MSERKEEALLTIDNTRFTQLPYKFPRIHEAYDLQEASFGRLKN